MGFDPDGNRTRVTDQVYMTGSPWSCLRAENDQRLRFSFLGLGLIAIDIYPQKVRWTLLQDGKTRCWDVEDGRTRLSEYYGLSPERLDAIYEMQLQGASGETLNAHMLEAPLA